jgi:pyrimidine-nucleoside phosphorylase
MDALPLIRRKRGGQELSAGEWQGLANAIVSGEVPDYQLAALLMVICYEGMSFAETRDLTAAMVASGQTFAWEDFSLPVVDKHSTGGVGDKTSLVLVPWLASCGVIVPKMSGRGLGFTGGTIDKLASIPGLRTEIAIEQVREQLHQTGCAVVSQTEQMVPADKVLYALRDATDTVDSDGLIAASVMSKKIAAGADYIVLDVKCGSGAFFRTLEAAQRFAETAVELGHSFGRRVGCVISDMSQPLGNAVGNALEVREVINMLEGQVQQDDVFELALSLGSVLLELAGVATGRAVAEQLMSDAWATGKVRQKFTAWVAEQGGDLEQFRAAKNDSNLWRVAVRTDATGYINAMNTEGIGQLARELGAGRMSKEDIIDHEVGVVCFARCGDHVRAGDTVAELLVRSSSRPDTDALTKNFLDLLEIGPVQSPQPALIHRILT